MNEQKTRQDKLRGEKKSEREYSTLWRKLEHYKGDLKASRPIFMG